MNSAYDRLRHAKILICWAAAAVVFALMVSTASAQPTEVLVYQFDPNTDNLLLDGGIIDRSGHGNNGSSLNVGGSEMSFVPGHLPTTTALYMAGDDDFPGTGIWTGQNTKNLGIYQGTFTVMAWVNRTSPKLDQMVFGTIVQAPCAGNDQTMLHLGFRGRDTYMGFWGNDSSAPGTPAPRQWHHVAWRYSTVTTNQDIFIDGVLANSDSGHAPFSHDQFLMIGRYVNYAGGATCSSGANSGAFAGAIEYPRIFNVSLRNDQIAAAAADQPIPP